MKLNLLIFFLFSFLIISCDSLVNNQGGRGGTVHTQKGGKSNSSVLVTGEGSDIEALPRFNNHIKASGAFQPNEPIQLTVSIRSRLPTQQANIDLALPEATALKENKTSGPATITMGKTLKPQASWSESFSQGQVLNQQQTITISQPGYYHLILTAKAKDANKLTKQGQAIKNTATNDIWLWLDKKGGKVTDKFNRSLFSNNLRPQPGPFTHKKDSPGLQYSTNGHTIHSLTGSVTAGVHFYDQPAMVVKPLKDALANYYVYDEANGLLYSGSQQTDSQGEFTFPCSVDGDTYEVNIFTENNKTKIFDGPPGSNPTTFVSSTTGDLQTDCGNTISLSSSYTMSHLFGVMNITVDNSRSSLQENRGLIPVYLSFTDEGSYYSPGGDYVLMNDKNENDNDIGGPYGDFVVAHEYGHAVHEKALGGNEGSGACPSSHFVSVEYNLQCAFSEGFADYHADLVDFPYFYFKTNPYVNNGEDGAIIEGAVAAVFWDLTDPANESFDEAHYPASYIADIIKDCKVDDGNLKRADGIDHLIACFQRAIPSYFGHFPTRSNHPTGYQENVTEPNSWSRTDIRKIWYKDLYDENYTPPPPPVNVTLTGPTSRLGNQIGTWTADATGGTGSYSYSWKYRERCTNLCTWGPWNTLAETSNQLTRSFGNTQQESREVQLKVIAESGGVDDLDVLTINVVYPSGSGLTADSLSENSTAGPSSL